MDPQYMQLELPSKFKVYKDVEPAKAKIRVLKGKDEKLIAEMTYDNFDRKFLSVMKNVVTGLDVEKITLGDRKYIMLWLAINSYSKDFPVEFVCETCLQKIEVTVDLAKFEVKDLPEDYEQPYKVELRGGLSIYLRLLIVEDELKVVDYEKSGQNAWLYRYALSIVDDKKSVGDKTSFLEDLDVKDVAKVRAFHEEYDHGPIMESKYVCPKCGGNGVVAVPFRLEMLFPYGKALKAHFGKRV